MPRTWIALVVAVAAGLLAVGAAAQEAPAPPEASPAPVPAEECTGERRSRESLAGLGGTPGADAPAPVAATPVGGEAADAATVAAVTEVLRRNLACTNAGDTLRAFATLTDRLAGELLAQAQAPPLDERLYDLLATPFPLAPADRTVLVAVEDVRVHPDGSVTATVTTASPETNLNLVRFVPADGSWLIDRIDPLDVPEATPAA